MGLIRKVVREIIGFLHMIPTLRYMMQSNSPKAFGKQRADIFFGQKVFIMLQQKKWTMPIRNTHRRNIMKNLWGEFSCFGTKVFSAGRLVSVGRAGDGIVSLSTADTVIADT